MAHNGFSGSTGSRGPEINLSQNHESDESSFVAYYDSEPDDDSYFGDRSETPYESTMALGRFLDRNGFFQSDSNGSLIADVACGTGSETAYFSRLYPDLAFLGVDAQEKFIAAARERYQGLTNLSFRVGNLYDLGSVPEWNKVNKVWVSQTLLALPYWKKALRGLISPEITEVAFSTLAWQGFVESFVTHFEGSPESPDTKFVNYNVYSIPAISEFMAHNGFTGANVEEFAIGIDLPAPKGGGLGSYTIRAESGKRLTFSAWQSMPWHFFHYTRA